jgi:hypothetical protein
MIQWLWPERRPCAATRFLVRLANVALTLTLSFNPFPGALPSGGSSHCHCRPYNYVSGEIYSLE